MLYEFWRGVVLHCLHSFFPFFWGPCVIDWAWVMRTKIRCWDQKYAVSRKQTKGTQLVVWKGERQLHTYMHAYLHTSAFLYTYFTEFTDKAISQNVRLLGCICKTCKNCDDCCCSTRLVAPTKTPLEREKRHNAVCDIAALNKTSKNNQAASARTSRPH
jgi:hypothetical protein